LYILSDSFKLYLMKLSSKEIALGAGLASLSAVFQLIHLGYRFPQWGMWLDLVAVTWIVAYFLKGVRLAFIVSVIGAIVITLFAPDTWLGASMKWLATAPLWLALAINPPSHYIKAWRLVPPFFLGIFIRLVIVIPLNYFYAIPIWTGMSPQLAMQVIPWYVIGGFNFFQSLIDLSLAWILVFKFKLNRYAD